MSREEPDPIADALNSLHDGEQAKPQPPADAGQKPENGEEELNLGTFAEDVMEGSTQDLSELAPDVSAAAGAPRSRPAPRMKVRRPTKMHHAGVKACLVIGMLLLIPALWAVAVLVGLSVPMSHRTSAKSMAIFMLVCWPVGGALIGGAIYFAKHYAKLDAMFDAAEADAARRG